MKFSRKVLQIQSQCHHREMHLSTREVWKNQSDAQIRRNKQTFQPGEERVERQLIESVGAPTVFFDWSKYRCLYGPREWGEIGPRLMRHLHDDVHLL